MDGHEWRGLERCVVRMGMGSRVEMGGLRSEGCVAWNGTAGQVVEAGSRWDSRRGPARRAGSDRRGRAGHEGSFSVKNGTGSGGVGVACRVVVAGKGASRGGTARRGGSGKSGVTRPQDGSGTGGCVARGELAGEGLDWHVHEDWCGGGSGGGPGFGPGSERLGQSLDDKATQPRRPSSSSSSPWRQG
jgi:hypothetical protein